MTTAQRLILVIGVAVHVAVLLFPPFIFQAPTSAVVNEGFAFILSPPAIGDNHYATINVGLLALEIAVASIVTGLLFLACSQKTRA
jgi:hypothetical protein